VSIMMMSCLGEQLVKLFLRPAVAVRGEPGEGNRACWSRGGDSKCATEGGAGQDRLR